MTNKEASKLKEGDLIVLEYSLINCLNFLTNIDKKVGNSRIFKVTRHWNFVSNEFEIEGVVRYIRDECRVALKTAVDEDFLGFAVDPKYILCKFDKENHKALKILFDVEIPDGIYNKELK